MSKKIPKESNLKIKNKKLIVSTKVLSSHKEIKLVRNNPETHNATKLSQVLEFLPSGFVYKDETGMGATTLELLSKRNSIIVEPIKITASSKAHKHHALYVGSNTKYHPRKTATDKDIKAFVNDNSISYKKIVVVADSLHKVIDAIGEGVFKEYFLLIDEVDSFQLDSTYRRSMEECFEIYHKFPSSQRAMLSATRIDFSDPSMNEPVTFFTYDSPSPRKISIYSTTSHKLIDLVAGMIFDCLRKNPSDKIFVAYNSVNGCYSIAQALVKKEHLKTEDIGIYCSTASKNKVGDYFKELDSDKLGFRLNFFTSAYFTGFDLDESYHLISVSGTSNEIHSLSDRRLKQIAGRSRTKLLSETILHDSGISESIRYNKNDVIEIANTQIEAFNCIQTHFAKHSALAMIYEPFIDRMSTAFDEFRMRFTKRGSDGRLTISYLNIDAYLESKRVQWELYRNSDDLKKALIKSGNDVHSLFDIVILTVEEEDVTQVDRDSQVRTVMTLIRETIEKDDPFQISDNEKLTSLQHKIVNDFEQLSQFIEPESLLKKMEGTLIGRKDVRKYNKLIFSANLCCYPDSNHFIQRFQYLFPLNSVHTSKDILSKLNQCFVECNIPMKLDSETKAVRYLKNVCQCSKNNNPNNGSTEGRHTIKNYNPFNFNVLKRMSSAEELTDMFEKMLTNDGKLLL